LSAPENERDLALIDAALAEGRATSSDPRERELEELALALRDDPPEPDPGFARELGRRVDDGFARPRRFQLPGFRMRMPRAKLPVLAGAAAALIAVVVAVGVLQGGEEKSASPAGTLAVEPGSEPEAAQPSPTIPPQGATGEVPGDPAVGSDSAASASPERRVERAAEMTLAAPADELQDVAQKVGQVAEDHRGYVVSSRIATGDDSSEAGNFVLRIPTDRLESALADLGKLGKVKARSESSQDMTAPFKNTEDRLGNLLLERRATEDKLDDAEGAEADELRSQLRTINAEIRDLSSRMDDLRRRTVFSTVTVSLEQERDSGAGGGDGPGGAWDDALATLSDALEIAIRTLGVALPLALIGLVGWVGVGVLRRRRREAALF
jgi:hypothetical protein